MSTLTVKSVAEQHS